MKYLYLLLLVLLAHSPLVSSSACTDACNANYTTGDTVTFCSTKGKTYTTKVSALYAINTYFHSCMAQCGVAILHVGSCDCPNDCFSSSGHGICSNSTSKCVCNAGRGGSDCSLVKCPSTCSGHGTCISQSNSKGGDICQCNDGWTSTDCSVQIPQFFKDHPYGSLPFGEVGGASFYTNDKYNDAHQFFNYSNIATIKLTISKENLQYMLDPVTLYETEYADAKLYFYNGALSKTSDVTFRTKGMSSRMMTKKSWNVKFPKGDSYRDLKGFSLKALLGDRQSVYQVIWEMYRAQKVQTYRHAHAQLYINDVFYGIMGIEERIDDRFMKSRYDVNPDKEANLYKLSPYRLQYLGDTAEDYQNFHQILFDNKPFYGIEQEEGNDDWTDLLDLVTALNSSDAIATEYVQNNFNLEGLLRGWVIETSLRNPDASLGIGNNWEILDSKEGSEIRWEFLAFDFDTGMQELEPIFAAYFGMTTEAFKALLNSGVTEIGGFDLSQFIMNENPYVAINRKDKPLPKAVNKIPGVTDLFTVQLKQFVQQIILDHPNLTEQIREAHYQLVRPIVATDRMYMISNTPTGNSMATFDDTAAATKAWMAARWAYLVTLVTTGNHGTCTQYGECTCNAGYFGETCDSFCGLEFTQTKTNGWTQGKENFTQWQVTLKVGSSSLRNVFLDVTANANTFNPWNIDKVAGSTSYYTLPSWQYTNGVLAANSNSVTFGYTISSSNPAKFRLQNNACAPASCPLTVSSTVINSWVAGTTQYQQVQLNVQAGAQSASEVKVQVNFQTGAYVSQSWNIAPSISSPYESSTQFTCSLYGLSSYQTSTSCGFIVASHTSSSSASSSPVFTTSFVHGTCF